MAIYAKAIPAGLRREIAIADIGALQLGTVDSPRTGTRLNLGGKSLGEVNLKLNFHFVRSSGRLVFAKERKTGQTRPSGQVRQEC
jgi:hypothetical protein